MNQTHTKKQVLPIAVDQPGIYRLRIQGRMGLGTQRRFEGLAIMVETSAAGIPVTTLTGRLADQSALHGLIARVRDLGFPLLLVELLGPVD